MSNESVILREMLMTEMSRRNTDVVADFIVNKLELFPILVDLYLLNEEPISRRAAWVVDTIDEQVPGIILPHFTRMVEQFDHFNHDGLKRSTLRMLNRHEFPEEVEGILIKKCFDWLLDARESVSVKVYSMDILYRLSNKETDIKKELMDTIEWRMDEGTAGFKSHAKKILRQLHHDLR